MSFSDSKYCCFDLVSCLDNLSSKIYDQNDETLNWKHERAPSRWILTDIYFVEKTQTLLNLSEYLCSKLFTAWSSRYDKQVKKKKHDYKQLLDEVSVISRIIKVEVGQG